jgi:hypothetical protein
MRSVVTTALTLVLASAWISAAAATPGAEPGRYKKQGDKCVWDANDNGPDQCVPGRYKKDGDKCVWDAEDMGPDQCRPAGRYKKDGDNCVWDAKDNGPDQCRPKPHK